MLGDISYHKATLQSEGKHSIYYSLKVIASWIAGFSIHVKNRVRLAIDTRKRMENWCQVNQIILTAARFQGSFRDRSVNTRKFSFAFCGLPYVINF